MKMIPHQAQRMSLPARLGAILPKRFQQPLPILILIILENRLPPMPAIHHTCPAAAPKLPAKGG